VLLIGWDSLSTNQKYYQDLGSEHHQYGISAFVTQTSFCEGSSGDLAKRQLFSFFGLQIFWLTFFGQRDFGRTFVRLIKSVHIPQGSLYYGSGLSDFLGFSFSLTGLFLETKIWPYLHLPIVIISEYPPSPRPGLIYTPREKKLE